MTAVVHPLLCFHQFDTNRACSCSSIPSISTPISRFSSLRRNLQSGFWFRAVNRSTIRNDPLVPNAKEETISESKQRVSLTKPKNEKDQHRFSRSSLIKSAVFLINGFRNGLKVDELGLEILSIALPAALALAADPLASLVDSAFVGHVGDDNSRFASAVRETLHDKKCKKLLPAVSTSLALAAGIGIAEAVALSIGSASLMNIMGIPVDSPMRLPAEQFLTLKSFGAPALVTALAAQGSFRGFMDTKTPLYAIGAGNLLNAILDPILIFGFGLGVGGAAIATVMSEYLIAFILLRELNTKVILIPPKIDGERIARYLQSGSLLIGRTVAILTTMTLATSMAARQGPVPMAAHQICLQAWFAPSPLTDALALAGQALLAGVFTQGDYKQAQRVIYRVLQIGLVAGFALAAILFLAFGVFCGLFSTDSDVLDIAHAEALFVAGSQPVVALAFVFDGLYYGLSDFEYAAYSMVFTGLISSMFLLLVAPVFRLDGVWTGLCLFMCLRVAAGVWRLGTKDGPWHMIRSEMLDK